MASFNRVILMGNLTHDPELRYTSNGSAVGTFSIAMNRTYVTQGGERKEETTFVRVTVWGRQGENCHQRLSKGSGVLVEGRLRQRTWETPEGEKRSTIEVVAQYVHFLPRTGSSNIPEEVEIEAPPRQLKGASYEENFFTSLNEGDNDVSF